MVIRSSGKERVVEAEDYFIGPATDITHMTVLRPGDLLTAIRENKPYNEAKRGAEASLVTVMGRMAAHTGQTITYEQALNHTADLAPGLDKITGESPAPLQAGPDGKYPVPQPGRNGDREF